MRYENAAQRPKEVAFSCPSTGIELRTPLHFKQHDGALDHDILRARSWNNFNIDVPATVPDE